MGIFSFLQRPKIVETKTFSEITGFSFEYPIFKGWEAYSINRVNDNESIIYLNYPENIMFEYAPQIRVVKSEYPYKGSNNSTIQDNPNIKTSPGGVKYYASYENPVENKNGLPYINFYADDSIVTIYPFMHEGNGYSAKVCADKIIETFEFNK